MKLNSPQHKGLMHEHGVLRSIKVRAVIFLTIPDIHVVNACISMLK